MSKSAKSKKISGTLSEFIAFCVNLNDYMKQK